MHKKGVIFVIAITIAALLLCCGIRLYRDRDERKLRQFLEQQAYAAFELESVWFDKEERHVRIEYYVPEHDNALSEALILRRTLEDYFYQNTATYAEVQIEILIQKRNFLTIRFANYDVANDIHLNPPRMCENCYDFHYVWIYDNYNDALSVLQGESDLESLYLAEFTEYSIDSLSDMENLRYLSIADENAPAHLFEAETYSELPEDCEVVVNNHHDIR